MNIFTLQLFYDKIGKLKKGKIITILLIRKEALFMIYWITKKIPLFLIYIFATEENKRTINEMNNIFI